MKKVSIITIDARKFVEDILELGKQGGVLTDNCFANKGLFLRAEVEVPDNAIVTLSERVAISAESIAEATLKKDEPKNEVEFVVEDRPYSREELEGFTIKQVREVTGLIGRDKKAILDEFFANKSVEDKTEE
jgi:carbamoylphosphate synthase small subunit